MRVLMVSFLLLLSACQSKPVAIWERQYLSSPGMTQPVSDLSRQLNNHVYFSKEGSYGSSKASAGGCGCN